jgi:ubiquinone/menaquinone biosynthesis C-methylase UbiE
MDDYKYQFKFSDQHKILYNIEQRQQKANKILSILIDCIGDNLKNLTLLDIGCSTGIMTKSLSDHFERAIGIDIDKNGLCFAHINFSRINLAFLINDAMNIACQDNSFDVVNCSQIYEHVPDCRRLMSEIYRVLKPEGVCFFAAGNRFVFKDHEYKLPFLSIMPKFLAHFYLWILHKNDFYYETFMTYWGLKKLVSKFEVTDYTKKIIQYPERFYANDMISSGSFKQKFALFILKYAYWICPTYIWILKKPLMQ